MSASLWAVLALAYHLASRLAYVLYVGLALRRQERTAYFTQRYHAEPAFRRFRRVAATIMNNDGVSFVVLCVVTRDTLALGGILPRGLAIAVGAVLVLVGVGVKLWAGATLGARAYYWHNFFSATEPVVANTAGPYRFLRNPMYTVGYLHTYGLALATGSLFGLIAALFDQAAILAFYWWVEKPHFERRSVAPSEPAQPRQTPQPRPSFLDSGARAAQNEGSPSRSHRT